MELTCRYGAIKEDWIGYEDEQHRCVCGDIVRDSVLEALLTTAQKGNKQGHQHLEITCMYTVLNRIAIIN